MSPTRRMKFSDDGSCVVVWPEGPVSLADLTDSFEFLGLRVATHEPLTPSDAGIGPSHGFTFEELPFTHSALTKMATAFDAAMSGITTLDVYTRLIGTSDVSWQDVALIRAACRYLLQAHIAHSESYMVEVLVKRREFVRQFIALFMAKFDPIANDRVAQIEVATMQLVASIESADTLDQDRILRGIRSFIDATMRTNWFQRDAEGRPRTYASFKLDPGLIAVTAAVVPHREVYVHSPVVEGVHLRSSLVARGGLRWSDRHEDFRTEALSLMTTQSVKNAPIVPSGAKGAFVVPGATAPAPDQIITAYRTFIRGLLDVTDNLVDGRVVRDPDTIAHDGDDPYLVVAADKGTARFSDTANAIAAEYGYWLGDAFASGGSTGYDHKAMGITARGTWVALRRHCSDRGIDIDTDAFTVVGIGDMSGDVFGNGMLLSRSLRLVAAFDNRHIFIDPDPDPMRSFAERRRLFALPGSSWADFDVAAVSPGGGVFSRSAKSISLSDEARDALGCNQTQLTPPEVIRAILKAPVDVLWNGGVGTYVKSSTESHFDAADPSNDSVRVDADQLRAGAIGEGGNLGLTQRARVEYANAGGRINADFIDNVAGVATSDREVNIKIALAAVPSLDADACNALTASVSDDVRDAVLRSCSDQTLAISIAEQRAPHLVDQHERLLEDLTSVGLVDRVREALPTEQVFAARARAGVGLVRPELAVLVARSKTMLAAELVRSQVPDHELFAERLTDYFPDAVVRVAGLSLENHRLRKEIVATSIADEVVNRMGPGVMFKLEERLGVAGPDAVLAYEVVARTLQTESLRLQILESTASSATIGDELETLQRVIEAEMTWLLRQPGAYHRFLRNPLLEIRRWHDPVAVLAGERTSRSRAHSLFGVLAMADLSLQTGRDIRTAAAAHADLTTALDLTDILRHTEHPAGASHWEVMGSAAAQDQLADQFNELVARALDDGHAPDPATAWIADHGPAVTRFVALMTRVRRSGPLDTARLSTIASEFRLLLR